MLGADRVGGNADRVPARACPVRAGLLCVLVVVAFGCSAPDHDRQACPPGDPGCGPRVVTLTLAGLPESARVREVTVTYWRGDAGHASGTGSTTLVSEPYSDRTLTFARTYSDSMCGWVELEVPDVLVGGEAFVAVSALLDGWRTLDAVHHSDVSGGSVTSFTFACPASGTPSTLRVQFESRGIEREEVTYDGTQPVLGVADERGRLVVVSETLGTRFDVSVTRADGVVEAGALVHYEEIDGLATFMAESADGRSLGFLMTPVAAVTSGVERQEVFTGAAIVTGAKWIAGLIAGGSFAVNMRQSHVAAKEVETRVHALPMADVENGVLELCVTPLELVMLLQTGAVQAEAFDGAFDGVGRYLLFSFVSAGATSVFQIGELGAAGIEVTGIAFEAPHLAAAATSNMAVEIREAVRSAYPSLGDFALEDTLQVTLIGYRVSHALWASGPKWGAAIISGVGCDKAAFGAPIGSVEIVSDLAGVSPAAPAEVRVQVNPPRAGVRVHLGEQLVFDFVAGGPRYSGERRYLAVTDARGVARFVVPKVDQSSRSQFTVTVPEQFTSITRELSWAAGARGDMPPPVYDVGLRYRYEARAGQKFLLEYYLVHTPNLVACEVDWGEGLGYERYECPHQFSFGIAISQRHILPHRYDAPGVYVARVRLSTETGKVSEVYAVIPVHPQRGSEPEIASLIVGHDAIDWVVTDADVGDALSCLVLSRSAVVWSSYPCPRLGSVRLPLADIEAPITFIASDGQNAAERVIVEGAPAVSVDVVPRHVALPPEGSQAFSAYVSGTTDTRVVWIATCGSIFGAGNAITYVAPAVSGTATCEVSATSLADERARATAVVTVSSAPTSGGALSTVSTSWLTSHALDAAGHPWSWGLVIDDSEEGARAQSIPVRLDMPEAVRLVQVSAGSSYAVALAVDGSAWSWGLGRYGTLGNGSVDDQPAPVRVAMPPGVEFVKVSAGSYHVVALDRDGAAWAWGRGLDYRLGNGSRDSHSTPVRVTMPSGVRFVDVNAGTDFTLALDERGHAWAWGRGYSGQLGVGSTIASAREPVAVVMPPGVQFSTISAGYSYALALDRQGRAWAWGRGLDGALGNGDVEDAVAPVLVTMPSSVAFTDVSSGWRHHLLQVGPHSLALDSEGRVWAWGSGRHGALGRGTSDDALVPVLVSLPAGTVVTEISAGGAYSLALEASGAAWAWGSGQLGQLGDGAMVTRFKPVRVATP